MEGITQIDKTKYLENCKKIVKEEIKYPMSEELLTIVTNEIMDTCMFIGGDFEEDNIRNISRQYVSSGALNRIKIAHGGIK